MIIIEKKYVTHHLSPQNPPVSHILPGEEAVFETYDCYMGQLLKENTTFLDVDRRLVNPATGPLFIEGAEPGDMLKIEILDIQLDPVGILDIGSGSGALKQEFKDCTIKRLKVIHGLIEYGKLKIPVKPMIGVIGVAPARDTVSTMTPKDHGGNMDCTQIKKGSTLYLPIFTKGALLSMGDLHAIMGDGEAGNCGVEIGGCVKVRISISKDKKFLFPLIENDDKWITIAYGDTLDEAAYKASLQMIQFLTEYINIDKTDAGMLIDMAGDLIICQIVNPCKTVRMEIDKWMVYNL